jgi:hypothetical protein
MINSDFGYKEQEVRLYSKYAGFSATGSDFRETPL